MSRRERLRSEAGARLANRAEAGGLEDFPVCRLVDLLDDPAMTEPTSWLVPGILPKGAAVLLYGSPKVGKTTLASALLAAVAAGRPFLDRPVAPAPVLYVDMERAKRLTVHRLKEPFADDRPPESILVSHRRPTIEAFRAVVRRYQVGLAVLDTLLRLTGLVDENSAAEVNQKLSPWVELAHEEGVTLLFNHHDRKGGGDNGAGARGSNNIVGTVDLAAHLMREGSDGDDGRRRLKIVSNFDEVEPELYLRREGGSYRSSPTPAQIRQDRILSALRSRPDHPASAEEVAQMVGESRSAVLPDLNLLVGFGGVVRQGRGVKGSPHLYRLAPSDSVTPSLSLGLTESGCPDEAA